ncbi:uncharacterized protein METZ01_LOCUS160297, partial [marine metagenome]
KSLCPATILCTSPFSSLARRVQAKALKARLCLRCLVSCTYPPATCFGISTQRAIWDASSLNIRHEVNWYRRS